MSIWSILRKGRLSGLPRPALLLAARKSPSDIVIFATGFDVMTGAMDRIDIRGRDQQSLKARWKEGLTSYLGMMTRGFPNFFWINGPHSQFYNPILLAEFQCNLIFDALTEMEQDGKTVIGGKC
jgi:cyclohexanone monooxygenase